MNTTCCSCPCRTCENRSLPITNVEHPTVITQTASPSLFSLWCVQDDTTQVAKSQCDIATIFVPGPPHRRAAGVDACRWEGNKLTTFRDQNVVAANFENGQGALPGGKGHIRSVSSLVGSSSIPDNDSRHPRRLLWNWVCNIPFHVRVRICIKSVREGRQTKTGQHMMTANVADQVPGGAKSPFSRHVRPVFIVTSSPP